MKQTPVIAGPAPYAPPGWKLVPIQATAAMLAAVSGYSKDQLAADAVWNAMVAAAPNAGVMATGNQSKQQRY